MQTNMQARLVVTAVLIGAADALSVYRGAAACRLAVPRARLPRRASRTSPLLSERAWDTYPLVRVEGSSLKTWDVGSEAIERVQLSIRSAGRPVHASVELWQQSPSYAPMKFNVWLEDGSGTPFHTIVETPKSPKTIAVFNRVRSSALSSDAVLDEGFTMEYPFEASVAPCTDRAVAYQSLARAATPTLLQGGQVTSWTFGEDVESIYIYIYICIFIYMHMYISGDVVDVWGGRGERRGPPDDSGAQHEGHDRGIHTHMQHEGHDRGTYSHAT